MINLETYKEDAKIYEIFLRRIKIDPNGCWRWTSSKAGAGYSKFVVGHRASMGYGHRYSYKIHKGPIPEKMTIDHLCRVRDCVNPEHLECVTQRENVYRGTGIAAITKFMRELPPEERRARALKASMRAKELAIKYTHCKNGHEYTEKDFCKNGWRKCSVCHREYARKTYRKNKIMKDLENT